MDRRDSAMDVKRKGEMSQLLHVVMESGESDDDDGDDDRDRCI